MTADTGTRTKWRRRRVVAVVTSLSVALCVGGLVWVSWPRRTTDRFVALVSGGRYEEAGELLAAPSAIRRHENGDVTITAADGSGVTLTEADLPLRPLDDFESRPRRDGIGDLVAGRYRFGMATAGAGVQRERAEPAEVWMDAVRGGVVIVTVVRH